jgi:hypothetical protein
MNLFQWLAISVLGLLLGLELVRFARGPGARLFWALRCLVWLAAALAIARPDLVQSAANAIGIGRGADVVLYVFVLLFPAVSFYLYSRCVRLQRQVTELVRHIAITEARRGAEQRPPVGG